MILIRKRRDVGSALLWCKMLAALSVIAKQTALICNACRTASEKSENAGTKRNFVQLAKDIANGTATVVQAVKVFMYYVIH